ncbi:MAG: PAS domain S-box protein [Candidatus Binataceae bacterium]
MADSPDDSIVPAQDALLVMDEDGRVADWNPRAEAIFGWGRNEALGHELAELIIPERFRAAHSQGFRRFLRTGQAALLNRSIELVALRRDGTEFPLEVTIAQVGSGDVRRFAARARDLSERERTEREFNDVSKRVGAGLGESEETFRKIFETAPVGIVMVSIPEGRFLSVNHQFLRLSGYRREEIAGKTMREIGRGAEQELIEKVIADTLASGSVHNVEAEAAGSQGHRRSLLLSAGLSEIHGQRCIVGFVRDITDRKRLESALVEAGQAAMAAAQGKSELLAWMSHEIRTPMNAILGMAELLWDTPLSREQREFVRIFRSTGSTLLNLVDGILDLSRAEAGRLSLKAAPFNLRELVESVIEILALRANRKGLRLTTEIDPCLPANLLGDALRLREVLLNLVENAIKFTETGTISIRAGIDAASPEMLHVSVADTGIGIPADKRDSIFLSFTQLEFSGRRSYGGSGLGLSIAKRLVELMGGTIRAESDLGRGSVFHFTVPLRTAVDSHAVSETADERPARLDPPPDGRPVRILLAEDSDDNSFLVESYLRGTPCVLEVAENGAVALARFKRECYDLVLMDMGMPVMDGYATVGEMRRFERENERRPTPIVALTAYALPEDFERTRAAGCDAYLTKPVRKATLLDMIREFTHGFR